MTTNQEIKLNMYLAVRNFVIPNEGITKELPNFPASYATLLSTIDNVFASLGRLVQLWCHDKVV